MPRLPSFAWHTLWPGLLTGHYNMKEKKCSSCKHTFPLTKEYFNKSTGSYDTFQHYCRECKSTYRKKREEALKKESDTCIWKAAIPADKGLKTALEAEILEVLDDYNAGMFPGEERVLKEDGDYFTIIEAGGVDL